MSKPQRPPLKRVLRTQLHLAPAHVLLLFFGLFMVFPFVWQIIMSLSTNPEVRSVPPTFWPEVLQWHNYADVFTKLPFMQNFWISVLITVIRTLAQLLFCSMAGYAFARMQFSGRGILFGAVLLILMVPSQVYLIPQYQIVQGLGLLETPWGIVLPGLFSAFGTFLMRQTFLSLPREMEEAARLDGCSQWQIFTKVMLPLAAPGLSAVAITTVLWSWNDLLWPLIVTTREDKMPLSVGIATLAGEHSTDYSMMMAASIMSMAPIFILFFSMQRRVISGLASSGLKG